MEKADIQKMIEDYGESCETKMYNEIAKVAKTQEEDAILRKAMDKKLDTIAKQAQLNHQAFKDHDGDEMEKYDQVIDSINNLTNTMKDLMERTADNTAYVQSETYSNRVKRDAELLRKKEKKEEAEALKEANKDKIDWVGVRNKAIGTAAVIMVGGMFTLLILGMKAYFYLGMDKAS